VEPSVKFGGMFVGTLLWYKKRRWYGIPCEIYVSDYHPAGMYINYASRCTQELATGVKNVYGRQNIYGETNSFRKELFNTLPFLTVRRTDKNE